MPTTRPRSRLTIAIVAGVVLSGLVGLWAASFPGGQLVAALVATVGFGLLAVVWLVLVILAIARRRFRWTLVALPLTAAVVLLLGQSNLPDRLGLALARSDLDQARASGQCPARVGWYPVARCTTALDEQVVIVEDAGFLNEEGFAHFDTPPEPDPGSGFVARHIAGGWYRVTIVW